MTRDGALGSATVMVEEMERERENIWAGRARSGPGSSYLLAGERRGGGVRCGALGCRDGRGLRRRALVARSGELRTTRGGAPGRGGAGPRAARRRAHLDTAGGAGGGPGDERRRAGTRSTAALAPRRAAATGGPRHVSKKNLAELFPLTTKSFS